VAAAESGESLYTPDGRLHVVSLATLLDLDAPTGEISTLEWRSGWDGDTWAETAPFDPGGANQSQPALALADGAVHAIWSASHTGADNDRRDVFLSVLGASGWSSPANLTGAIEQARSHIALGGDLAVSRGGQLAIVYSAQPVDSPDVREVRVARIVAGALSGEPITVVGPCHDKLSAQAAIAFDGTGALHVLASCRPEPSGLVEVLWATDAGGDWRTAELPARDSAIHPDLVVDDDGVPHAVWIDFLDFDNSRLLYSHLVAGEWSAAISVAENATVGRLAFAPDRRTVVAYGTNELPIAAFVTSSDGAGFAEPCAIELPLFDVPRTLSLALDRDTAAPTVIAGAPFSGDEDDSLAIGWFEPSIGAAGPPSVPRWRTLHVRAASGSQ
jgi:hypothetical protein